MAKPEQEETLQRRVMELIDENLQMSKRIAFLEKRTDTVFCPTCPSKCSREQITCELCKMITQPDPEFSADGVTRAERKKVYICSPLRGDGTPENYKANWAKTREYATKAFKLGYMPVVPHLYFPLFADDTDAKDRHEGMAQGLGWLFEVYNANGEFWICADPATSKGMHKEIHIAEALGMTIRYHFDHPEARNSPAQLQRPDWVNKPKPEPMPAAAPPAAVPAPKKEKPQGDPSVWAQQSIASAKTVDDVKRVKIWAHKNVPKQDLGRVTHQAGQKIKALSQHA